MADEIAEGTGDEIVSFDHDRTKTTHTFWVNRSTGTATPLSATGPDGKPFTPNTSDLEVLGKMALRVADDQAQR